jgi:hypothetical protein
MYRKKHQATSNAVLAMTQKVHEICSGVSDQSFTTLESS